MVAQVNGRTYICRAFSAHAVLFDEPLVNYDGEDIAIVSDDGFKMAEVHPSRFSRWWWADSTLFFSDEPEPEPAEEPAPEITTDDLLEAVMELAALIGGEADG